jgi:hypothetical protein
VPTAIALSGGGAKGDFEVGALQDLYDNGLPQHGKQQLDILCGYSDLQVTRYASALARALGVELCSYRCSDLTNTKDK